MGKYKTQEEHITDFKKVHGNRYNYSEVKYLKPDKVVEIICYIHGPFFQKPSNHKMGCGCPDCSKLKNKLPKKALIKHIDDFNKVHNNKYNYSKVNYKDTYSKIEIICPLHKEFWQTPSNHKQGTGCPDCYRERKISINEEKISEILEENNISFNMEYIFKELPKLRYDFYIPSLNLAIEYDGELHYKSVKYFGGNEGLFRRQKLDKIKSNFCKENNINLLRIPYWNKDNIENILKEIICTKN